MMEDILHPLEKFPPTKSINLEASVKDPSPQNVRGLSLIYEMWEAVHILETLKEWLCSTRCTTSFIPAHIFPIRP